MSRRDIVVGAVAVLLLPVGLWLLLVGVSALFYVLAGGVPG